MWLNGRFIRRANAHALIVRECRLLTANECGDSCSLGKGGLSGRLIMWIIESEEESQDIQSEGIDLE